ncbi:2-phosphoxylose phosphatase 1-like isoform X2 [Liolophura sinensis]|uniref:2-phosphoxylose phosphatase 1-like isoform X2 n=1 Tax=Liolophura sinensis TaxID=3198878 RepID=UPI0031582BA7
MTALVRSLVILTITTGCSILCYIYLVNDGPLPGGSSNARESVQLDALPNTLDPEQPMGSWMAADIVPPMKIPDMVQLSSRIAEYCNHPALGIRGHEGEAPAQYKLISVHVVIRHGDRTAMYGFNKHPNPIIPCVMDYHTLSHHPKLRSFVPTMYSYSGKQHPQSGFKNWALFPDRKHCRSAELTGQGALQHLLLGDHFNKQYIHKWQLFDGKFSPDKILVRATEFSRTYQSAIALLYGFLPQFNLTELNIHRSSNIYFCDNQYANTQCICPAINGMRQSLNKQASSRKNSPVYKEVTNHIAEVYDLKRSQLLWVSAMMDVFMVQACHDIKLKCNAEGTCITQKTLEDLWAHLDQGTLADVLDPDKALERMGRVAMHPLLAEIANRMKNISVKTESMPRFVLYSGHDTTVSPLATALGIHKGKWPPYATRLVFEQYAKTVDDKVRHYVRVVYNGVDVTKDVRFCDKYQKDGFCELKHFLKFVKHQNFEDLNVKTYEEACRPK